MVTIVVFVGTDQMIALANDSLARFEAKIIELRVDWLEELAGKMTARYAPFVGAHPKAQCFESLLAAEEEYYQAEAEVAILEREEQTSYLDQQRKRLHDLFLSQLQICGEYRLAEELTSEFEDEQTTICAVRCKFLDFGSEVAELAVRMERLYATAQDEEDEDEVRKLAARVMRTVRLERRNCKLYVP